MQEILAGDAVPAPETLRTEHVEQLGVEDIDVDRYTSRAWHDLEVERVWKRTWQMACREEELATVGDTVVYDVAGMSILVVRSEPGRLQAFHNACLHRGTQLRSTAGHVPRLRCPFHGWTWNLDGSLKQIPCEWDFPHVDPARLSLPAVQVDTWGGWVFVNPDLSAPPLAEHLGSLPEHFPWDTSKRYKRAHVTKVMDCNWKVCLEAFLESYHVIATHPQLLKTLGDANTQYDTFAGQGARDPGWNRMITPSAVASPHLGEVPEDDILRGVMAQYGMGDAEVSVPDGMTARQMLSTLMRSMQAGRSPASFDGRVVSDSEALDSILYFIFPNMQPWGGLSPINYRFRPDGNDPDRCIMDVIFLSDFDGDRPPPAQVTHLGVDDGWTLAPELGPLAMVFDQDTANLPRVQRGLHATRKPGVTLGLYQESRIRQFHTELGRWISG